MSESCVKKKENAGNKIASIQKSNCFKCVIEILDEQLKTVLRPHGSLKAQNTIWVPCESNRFNSTTLGPLPFL